MENKFIRFVEDGSDPYNGKSQFRVVSRSNDGILGDIYWYPNWRQFIFESEEDVIWSWDCLKGVSEFMQELNEAAKKVKHGS